MRGALANGLFVAREVKIDAVIGAGGSVSVETWVSGRDGEWVTADGVRIEDGAFALKAGAYRVVIDGAFGSNGALIARRVELPNRQGGFDPPGGGSRGPGGGGGPGGGKGPGGGGGPGGMNGGRGGSQGGMNGPGGFERPGGMTGSPSFPTGAPEGGVPGFGGPGGFGGPSGGFGGPGPGGGFGGPGGGPMR